MKIFLSWSGDVSHKVASALHDWLPCVIQAVKPFISSGDISKGDRWSEALAQELQDSQFGIICVTPYNVYKSWMNFEAGALSKFIQRSCVVPFLFRMDRSQIFGPLTQFQSTIYSKDDVLNLLYTINGRLEAPLDHELLQRTFDVWWDELAKVLDAIPISSQNETRTFYKWLYTLEDIEIHANNKSVWIITSDAYRYAIESRMKQQVLQSAKSGTKYRYFLPASSRTAPDDYEGELKVLASQSQNNVEYRLFDADVFETQVASDYLILNPDGEAPLRVFVRLPIADHSEYWFKTDDRSANGFTRRFRNLWDERKTLAASG